jgi:UDP-N-acetylmuramyl pentapeptide phosphotransferase/UDP-N-acetylglucosamine-1-phosphate transferase
MSWTSVALAFAVGLVGLAVAAISPVACMPVLRHLGIIDRANERSSHTAPTIRGLGVACSLAVIAAWASAIALGSASVIVVVVLGTGLAASALGLVEDVRGLGVGQRLAVQALIGLGFGVVAVTVAGAAWWLAPLLAWWLVSYVNAANFMDGVDSISAFHAMVAGGYFALLGLIHGQTRLLLLGVILAVVFAGFLPWNLAPPRWRVFLGDSGSYLLGGLIAATAAAAFLLGMSLLASLAPTLPYLADTGVTLAHRIWRREPVTQAHRMHVYQRLLDHGWSHIGIGATVALVGTVCGAAALAADGRILPESGALLIMASALALYLALPRLAAGIERRRSPV